MKYLKLWRLVGLYLIKCCTWCTINLSIITLDELKILDYTSGKMHYSSLSIFMIEIKIPFRSIGCVIIICIRHSSLMPSPPEYGINSTGISDILKVVSFMMHFLSLYF